MLLYHLISLYRSLTLPPLPHTQSRAHTRTLCPPPLSLSFLLLFSSSSYSVLFLSLSLSASGISYGRITTLFLLGYELCSAFIRRHGAALFLSFIGRILNYLIRFLKDIGFFDWLVRHSWVSRSKNFLHAQSVVNSL